MRLRRRAQRQMCPDLEVFWNEDETGSFDSLDFRQGHELRSGDRKNERDIYQVPGCLVLTGMKYFRNFNWIKLHPAVGSQGRQIYTVHHDTGRLVRKVSVRRRSVEREAVVSRSQRRILHEGESHW